MGMTQPMYGDYRDLQYSTVTCQYIIHGEL